MIPQYSSLQQYTLILMSLQVNCSLVGLGWVALIQTVRQLCSALGCGLGSDLLHTCLFGGPEGRGCRLSGHAFLTQVIECRNPNKTSQAHLI